DDVGGRTVATGPQRELHRPTLGPRDHDNATCGPPGWDGPHGQARLGAGSGQNRPAFMPASVTRETWKVCTDDGTFPSAGISALTGIPVLALIVSTSLPAPPNTSGPAVRI